MKMEQLLTAGKKNQNLFKKCYHGILLDLAANKNYNLAF